ncbi:MAG: DNA-directed RNA polymerase subunit omega [Acidobacteriota bacterium]|nr:DNA-directed RNA polymerase subunit omega [Blastocatellia bacterium]MDW8411381.1 DNA-directed RNA polymerase subunit omega [Acidobacteriota bacterium]
MKKYEEGVVSKYQLINVAARRCRQLRSGATPRIQYSRSKNFARIALEEVKAGKVGFEQLAVPARQTVDDSEGLPVGL